MDLDELHATWFDSEGKQCTPVLTVLRMNLI